MLKKFYRNSSKWWLLMADCLLVMFSVFAAFELRFNFQIIDKYYDSLLTLMPIALGIRLIFFIIFRTYSGLLRYTGLEDLKRIAMSVACGTAVFYVVNMIYYKIENNNIVPTSIYAIDFVLLLSFLTTFRAVIKIVLMESGNNHMETKKVLILGSDEQAISTKRTLEQDKRIDYDIVGFLDDDHSLKGRIIAGVKIYSLQDSLQDLITKHQVDLLLLGKSNLTLAKKQEVVDACLANDVKVLNVPDPEKWINGELSINQLKEINIESLLERDPINLDISRIDKMISGSKVLVTGGAGSIGSELVRQILKFNPKKVMVLDQAESALYEVELELNDRHKSERFEIVLADIRNADRMRRVFDYFRPDYVYHAAAYKHVPMMENNPSESILTNVLGSITLARLSVEFGVKKFVMISTDKAVNPTNVMGASKRIAEIFVQSLDSKQKAAGKSGTQFITTRFGNVLGSNGSVIQLFKKQIQNGGPLTITHPDVTRFFMTIPEACQLVLEAGMMGEGGEIFIFDMGKSVKIIDLAKNMIRLAGLELGKDINLVFSGLRPGEKLYEELLNDKENTITTHHEKIMIAKVRAYNFDEVERNIKELIELFDNQDNDNIVRKMKELVPEYISNNSPFTRLDEKEVQATATN